MYFFNSHIENIYGRQTISSLFHLEDFFHTNITTDTMSSTRKSNSKAPTKAQLTTMLGPLFKHLSPGTSGPRIGFLANSGISPTSYDILRNPTEFMAKYVFNSNVPTTRATRMWHVITFLEAIDQKELAATYHNLKNPVMMASKAMQEDTTTTVRADRYEVPLTQLRKTLLDHKPPKLVRSTDYGQTLDRIRALQSYIILALYVLEPPPRNDLWNLRLVDGKAKASDKTSNYIIVPRSGGATLVFQDYKNAKLLGRIERKLKDASTIRAIRDLVILYTDVLGHKPEYLLNMITRDDEIKPDNSDAMSKRVALLSKHMFGKPLSINDYRHLYEINLQGGDDYKDMSYTDKKAAHGELMHGVETALKYNRT